MTACQCFSRIGFTTFIFSTWAVGFSTTPGVAAHVPSARIEALKQEFSRAYNAGSAVDLANLLVEDAVWMPPGEPSVVGRNAIGRRYALQFATTKSDFAFQRGVIRVSADMAWLRGTYRRVDTPVLGGPSRMITGKFLMVFSRERGDWRIVSNTWNADETPLQVDAQIALHSLRALTEWRLRDVAGMLSLIAGTPQAKTGDWDTMKGLLASLGDTGILANAIWFVMPDGYYYTVEAGFTGLNLTDRPYFPGLMAGQSVLGTLVISRSTGKRSVIIAEPILNGTQVIGGVGVSYSVDRLSQEIDEQMQLPAATVFYALDLNGQSALHRDPTLMFEYPSDMGSPSLSSAVVEMLSKDSGTVEYVFRDMHKVVLFERSSVLGWVFALGFSEPAIPNMR